MDTNRVIRTEKDSIRVSELSLDAFERLISDIVGSRVVSLEKNVRESECRIELIEMVLHGVLNVVTRINSGATLSDIGVFEYDVSLEFKSFIVSLQESLQACLSMCRTGSDLRTDSVGLDVLHTPGCESSSVSFGIDLARQAREGNLWNGMPEQTPFDDDNIDGFED